MDTWLNADPHNVVVLHNKVRVGVAGYVCVRVYVPARITGLCESGSLCLFSFLGIIHSVWGGTHKKWGLPACGALRCVDNQLFLLFKIQPHLLPPSSFSV